MLFVGQPKEIKDIMKVILWTKEQIDQSRKWPAVIDNDNNG